MAGGYGAGDPPDPIPNSEVKTRCADGTAGATRWESTAPPAFFMTNARPDPRDQGGRLAFPLVSAGMCFGRHRPERVNPPLGQRKALSRAGARHEQGFTRSRSAGAGAPYRCLRRAQPGPERSGGTRPHPAVALQPFLSPGHNASKPIIQTENPASDLLAPSCFAGVDSPIWP